MASIIDLLPIAKIMYSTLNAVIKAKTTLSPQGKITRVEIETILKGQVENVVNTIGPDILHEKQ